LVGDLGLSFLLAVLAGIAWYFARSAQEQPTSLWLTGWGFLFISGACAVLGASLEWLRPLSHLLGPFLPAFLLAGALAYTGAPIPAWLAPSAVALGVLRWGLAQTGWAAFGHAIALGLEPAAEIVAAVVVFRFVCARGAEATRAEHLLAPGFVAVALVDGAASLLGLRESDQAPSLLAAWAVVAPFAIGTQIRVGLERVRTHGLAEQQRIQRALSNSEERFRALTENAFDLIAETDGGGRVTYANARLEQTLGCPGGALVGRSIADRVHPEDRATVTGWLRDVVESGAPLPIVSRWRHDDGSWRWIESAARAFRADRALGVVVCACDVSERMQMEEDLRRAKAAEEQRRLEARLREVQRLESLGVLAGNIAHDFNNLLTVILGNSSAAQRELAPDSPVAQRLGRIHSAARHGSELVEQLLTYSGKASLERKPIDLAHLVRELQTLLKASVSTKVHLVTERIERVPPIEGDATQLRQVVLNLVSNASEALGEHGGVVSLRTGIATVGGEDLADASGSQELRPGEYVFLEVGDTGPGIEEAIRARIFDPFFTTRVDGRGIGLASVLGIVQAHQGAIKLESRPRHGAVFRVLLPRAGSLATAATSPPTPAKAPPASGTVLLVDDDEAVRELGAEFLARSGFEVKATGGGREAVAILRAHPGEIDAVVLDLMMPDCDGEETLKRIREVRSDIPVILATGFFDEAAFARFAQRGVAGFLRKPYEAEELVERVRSCLGNLRLHRTRYP
jgi:two-component system cell cycle sensor histidine kinase/response regulator CckA